MDEIFEPLADEDSRASSNLFQIKASDKQAQMPDYHFAPKAIGSLYVKLRGDRRQALLGGVTSKPQYVSVALLMKMQEEEIDWKDMGELGTSNSDTVQKEREFIKKAGFKSLYVPPKAKPKKKGQPTPKKKFPPRKQCMVPILEESGKFNLIIASDQSFLGEGSWYERYIRQWAANAIDLLSVPSFGSHVVKPPRTAKVPLQHDLMILIDQRAYDRFGDTNATQNIFQDCINKMKTPVNGTYSLKVISEADPSNMVMTSINPFELYKSFVHFDDWHTYMDSLSTGANPPIRPFLTPASDFTRMDRVNAAITNRNTFRSELIVQAIASKGGYSKWSDSIRRAIMRLGAKEDHNNNLPGYCTSRWTELSAGKIKNASGTRSVEDSQKQVMGVSAPDLARSLNWSWNADGAPNNNQMKNNLYIAEWLHLNAYSFGGFLDEASTNQGATSQMAENLVLGTSEANSLMTRYEYAWQNLIKDEMTLREKLGIDNVAQGLLDVETNPPDEPILFDIFKDNKYGVTSVNALQDDGTITQGSSPPYQTVDLGDMRRIATAYKFIAYSVKWRIGFLDQCYILGRANPSTYLLFFPFMRPFFHVMEQELDSLLYDKMKELAEAELKSNN